MLRFTGRVAALFVVLVISAPALLGESLRLGYFPNVTHAQALYAKAKGTYEKALGVPIEWVAFNAGPTAIEAIFADEIAGSYIGPNPTINGYVKSHGEKFVVVAGAASGGAGLVVAAGSGIENKDGFHGKTIATPQLGNTQDVAARRWFMSNGYRFTEKGGTLSLIPVANPDQLVLLKKKEIDGAWTVEPWLSRLQIEGGARLILDEKDLWPEGRYVTTNLILSRKFLSDSPELARKLLAAHVQVTAEINADKIAAAKEINGQIKKETGGGLPEEVLKQAFSRVEFTWDPVRTSLRQSARAAFEIGYLKSEADLSGLYELGLLNSVLKEKGYPELGGS